MKLPKKLTRKKKIILSTAAIAVIALAAMLVWSNSTIETEFFNFDSSTTQGDGLRIVQVSDFHNAGKWFEEKLVDEVKSLSPDIIVITGDTVDSQLTDIEDANRLLSDLSKLADCYLVWGNHEIRLSESDLEGVKKCCVDNGIALLHNSISIYTQGENKLIIAGTTSAQGGGFDEVVSELGKMNADSVIWLHHYPEDMEYIAQGCESIGISQCLMFSGHAHGGLIGLPLGNGLFAPGQGAFPEYTSGKYKSENGIATMLLSRGVGNSGFTKRLFNRPHIIVCDIE